MFDFDIVVVSIVFAIVLLLAIIFIVLFSCENSKNVDIKIPKQVKMGNPEIVNNNYISKQYSSVEVVSFFFPLLGLFIYAINIGRNDKVAEMALRGVVEIFILSIVLIGIALFIF